MKSDRQTYSAQYLPSGGLARMIDHGLPLARGDTGSEGIAQLRSANVIPERSYRPAHHTKCALAGGESYLKRKTKIPAFAGMTGIQRWNWSPPYGKPPAGFSELDIGEPPDVECDVGRTLDKLVSSELQTTKLTDDVECCQEWRFTPWRHRRSFPPDRDKSGIRVRTEVLTPQEIRHGYCLTMDRTRFQTCPELVEGCQN